MSAHRTAWPPSLIRPWPRATHWAILLATLCGCGKAADSGSANKSDSSAHPTPTASSSPAAKADPKHPVVQIDTNLGAIKIRLDAETSPATVQNFLNLVREGFYKNAIFHYVAPDKMIVGGGYSAEYELKPTRSTVRNEAHNGRKNVKGTIAMARDPALIDSASSQFFINLEVAPRRDYAGDTPEQYGYCVFGDVIEGLVVAEKISKSSTVDHSQKSADLAQTPKTPVVISGIKILM